MVSAHRRRNAIHRRYERLDRELGWLSLSGDQMSGLLDRLGKEVATYGCDNSLRFSEAWAGQQDLDWPPLRSALAETAGECDCAVLAHADPDAYA